MEVNTKQIKEQLFTFVKFSRQWRNIRTTSTTSRPSICIFLTTQMGGCLLTILVFSNYCSLFRHTLLELIWLLDILISLTLILISVRLKTFESVLCLSGPVGALSQGDVDVLKTAVAKLMVKPSITGKYMSRHRRKPTLWFPTMSNTNRVVWPQKRGRSLKFRV